MATLQIGGSSVGYDTSGLLDLINDINLKVIPSATKTIASSSQNVRSAIDSVWVGASSEAFKEKLTYDTEVLCQTLTEVGELIRDDVHNVGSNVEEYDEEIARQLFGVSSGGDGTGGYRDVSSVDAIAREKVESRHAVANAIASIPSKIGNVLERTGATVGTAVCGVVEGVGEFGEALVDTVAVLGTAVATPFTWLFDKIFGTNSTDAMWEGTKGFVAEKWVSGAFDSFYDNTAVGNWMKTNAYGYETTRSISSGIGYTVGVVALTVVTAGAGGAAVSGTAAATSTAVSTASLATTATIAGFGRGTETAWANGASTGEGLLYGLGNAAWEGTQFYVGGKIAGIAPFESAGANIATRIFLDTADGAAEGFVQPALDKIYKDGTYAELFEQAGGWKNVGVQAAIGAIGSTLGETKNIGQALASSNATLAAATWQNTQIDAYNLQKAYNGGLDLSQHPIDLTPPPQTALGNAHRQNLQQHLNAANAGGDFFKQKYIEHLGQRIDAGSVEAAQVSNTLARLSSEGQMSFWQHYDRGKGAYCSVGAVKAEGFVGAVMDHENGHAMFNLVSNKQLPSNFSSVVAEAQMYSSTSTNALMHQMTNDFNRVSQATYAQASSEMISEIQRNYGVSTFEQYKDIRTQEIKAGLKNGTMDANAILDTYGVKKSLLDRFSTDRLARKMAETELNKAYNSRAQYIYQTEYGNTTALSDIVDAVYNGDRVDLNGNPINIGFGHGANYYHQGDVTRYHEMIANYNQLKVNGGTAQINQLTTIFGKDFTDMLETTWQEFVQYGNGTR